jgi:NAD(P)-dependent dehydrogenase (short-subunit alcohol dehydrogenase family)
MTVDEKTEARVAVVTGASSGLGRACATRLSEDGWRVALLARSAGDLEAVAERCGAADGRALALPTDLADADAVVAAVERTVQEWGRVDALVNAAATDVPGPVEGLGVEDWDRVMAVNLRAPFLLSRAVFPHLRRQGGGTVVNVSSVAGRRGWAEAAAYCSSKFALTGFTQSLAAEGREHGIRACVVYPGAMATAWGTFGPGERDGASGGGQDQAPDQALPPEQVADLVSWIVHAPPGLVLPEVTVTPLHEGGWP